NQLFSLNKKLKSIAPSHLGGFKDLWESISILPAEGLSLQMKKFCLINKENCPYLEDNFIDCPKICETIASKLVQFLHRYLFNFIKKNGADINGDYPLYKLFNVPDLMIV
ncbi:MAG: hypothetical protein ACFE96_06050, partial [Candidatus Hermodarchaeota archaeon]